MNLKDMTIRNSLKLYVAAILVLFSGLGAIAWLSIGEFDGNFRESALHASLLRKIGEAQLAREGMRAAVHEAVAAQGRRDQAQIEAIRRQHAVHANALSAALGAIGGLDMPQDLRGAFESLQGGVKSLGEESVGLVTIPGTDAQAALQKLEAYDQRFAKTAEPLAAFLLAVETRRLANEALAKARVEQSTMQLAVAVLIGLFALALVTWWLFWHFAQRIDQLVLATEIFGAGECDLTRRLPAMGGAFGKICRSLNTFVGQLHTVVAGVASNAGEIARAANQISTSNTELSARTEEQASSLEETASSMDAFTSSVKHNAENSRLASELAHSATTAAQRGGDVVGQAVAKIAAANASSRSIGAIVTTIDSIAFQTNILALNAAVEAARAGEQGRGFAVVASEVRSLSQRCAASAKEIKTLVGVAISQVDDGAKLVAEAGGSMHEIISASERVAEIMNEIAAATREQTASIEQVNRTIRQMENVTQQNAAIVEEAAAAAESMREQAEGLSVQVSRFRLDEQRSEPPMTAGRYLTVAMT